MTSEELLSKSRDEFAQIVANSIYKNVIAQRVGRSWFLKHCGKHRLKYIIIANTTPDYDCADHPRSEHERVLNSFYICACEKCPMKWEPAGYGY